MSAVRTFVVPFLCWYTMYSFCMYIIQVRTFKENNLARNGLSFSLNHTFSSLPFYNLHVDLSSSRYLYIVIIYRYIIYSSYKQVYYIYMCACALPGNGSVGVPMYIYAHIYAVQSCICGSGESSTEKFQGGTLTGN